MYTSTKSTSRGTATLKTKQSTNNNNIGYEILRTLPNWTRYSEKTEWKKDKEVDATL